MEQRILSVALVILVAACGEPIEATAPSSGTTLTGRETTTTVPVTAAMDLVTTTTSDNAGELGPDQDLTPSGIVELLGGQVARPELVPGEPIDRPSDFPTIEDLAGMADGFLGPAHRRALISSYVGPNGDSEALIAAGVEPQSRLEC